MRDKDQLQDRVRNVETRILAEDYKVLRKTHFEYRRNDGAWQTMTRESYDTGDGAAVLPVDRARGLVLLIRQFRWPVYQAGHDAQLIEAIAGQLDGDDPATCAAKEAMEEAGVAVTGLVRVLHCFTLPGLATERLSLFLAEYDSTIARQKGGGLADEGEDIEVLEMTLDAAMAMVTAGEIIDAKAILLLQAAALQRAAHPSTSSG